MLSFELITIPEVCVWYVKVEADVVDEILRIGQGTIAIKYDEWLLVYSNHPFQCSSNGKIADFKVYFNKWK